MIDIDKAKSEFMEYVKNYDQDNPRIVLKISHSFRVMEQSKKIAESLNLEDEQTELATLIGLLHDIGRFKQLKLYETFIDKKSVDHGDLGAEILSDKAFLRRFISDDKYDNIIITAVRNHNKYKIQDGLTDLELLHSKIIRDVDKLDILYEATESFWYKEAEKEYTENSSTVDENYLTQIKNRKSVIIKKGNINKLDKIVSYMGFVFDFNFEYTFRYIYKNDYISKLIKRYKIKSDSAKKQIDEIKKIVDEFILEKISQTSAG